MQRLPTDRAQQSQSTAPDGENPNRRDRRAQRTSALRRKDARRRRV